MTTAETQDPAAPDTSPSEAPPEGLQPAAPADFGPLLAEAQAVDGARATGGDTLTAAAELKGALELARAMVRPAFGWWPDFAAVWSDKALDGIASSGAEVMQRHGWTLGDWMGQYGPYIALGMATVPPCAVTYQAIQHRKAQLAQEDQQRGRGPDHDGV